MGHIATGSTCQAPNNNAEQQGAHPTRTGPVVVMSNETSNHNAAPSQRDEATIISHFAKSASPSSPSRKPRIAPAIVMPQEGRASPWYIMTHGTAR